MHIKGMCIEKHILHLCWSRRPHCGGRAATTAAKSQLQPPTLRPGDVEKG